MSEMATLPPAPEEQSVDVRLAFPAAPRTTWQVLRWAVANVEELITAVLIGFMIALVNLSVVFRYLLNRPFSFTEEVVLLCMVWVCFLGAAIATKDREHIVIDLVLALVPKSVARAMEVVTTLVTVGLLAILAWQGYILVDRTLFMQTTALQIPVGFMYSAIPISSVLMIVYNLRHLYRDLRHGRGG